MSDAAREVRRLRYTILAIVVALVSAAIVASLAIFVIAPSIREQRAYDQAQMDCLRSFTGAPCNNPILRRED
jgi:predicted cobalt transporter CbtA